MFLKTVALTIEEIYVPVRLRKAVDQEKVQAIAEDIIENGQKSPIQVRRDENRYVLVRGVHRLEALRALGEETIEALIVHARRV
jgi:ParB-like chromosome segregation protein Spo0J